MKKKSHIKQKSRVLKHTNIKTKQSVSTHLTNCKYKLLKQEILRID